MDYLYGPIDAPEPTGFEPLDLDDEELEDDWDDTYADEEYEEDDDEYDEPGLKGFDDLKPFGSFDDGFGWDDTFA